MAAKRTLARKRMKIIIETVDNVLPHVKGGGRQHKALLKVRSEAAAKLKALTEH